MIKSHFNLRTELVAGVQRIIGIGGPGIGFQIVPGGEWPLGYFPFWARFDGNDNTKLLIDSDRPFWCDPFRTIDLFSIPVSGANPDYTPAATFNVYIFEKRTDGLGAPTARRLTSCILQSQPVIAVPATQPGQNTHGWLMGPNWRSWTAAIETDGDISVWYLEPPYNPAESSIGGYWRRSELIPAAEWAGVGTLATPITREILMPGNGSHQLAGQTYAPRIAFMRETGTAATHQQLLIGLEV